MKRSMLLAVVAVLAVSSCSKSVEPSGVAGVCDSITNERDEGQSHITSPAKGDYKTDPPTSGSHYASPSPTGVFTSPQPAENLVHNLEHGHVVIWYQPANVRGAVLNKLVALVKESETRVVLVPRSEAFPNAEAIVAFTAWGRMQTCTSAVDAFLGQARDFIRRFVGKGPEGDIPGRPNA